MQAGRVPLGDLYFNKSEGRRALRSLCECFPGSFFEEVLITSSHVPLSRVSVMTKWSPGSEVNSLSHVPRKMRGAWILGPLAIVYPQNYN